MTLQSARVSSKTKGDSSSATSAAGEPPTKKRTRGPNSGKALTAEVERSGRLRLVKPDGGVHSGAAGKYATRVGGLIRDNAPMVWPEWSEVPQEVKNQVNNAMSAWFEIPADREDLLDTYCRKIQAKRYSDWKYDLHRHFLKYGDGRDGTPLQFERREYDWLHLKACHFNNPNSKARGTINAVNRVQNTVPHHGSSRRFERWFDISAEECPEGNRYVEALKKCYPNSLEEQERVRQAADTVLPEIVRETQPAISDADMSAAISQVDMSDPCIGARIFGTAFDASSSSSNTFHCLGMGRAGDGILKTTPGFQKKGGSSSSQVAQLTSQMQRMAEENAARMRRMADENARLRQYQRDMAEYQRAMAEWQ